MKTSQELRTALLAIDHRGYPAYKDLKGEYTFPGYLFSIDHVQGDPFASPSRVSIHVPIRQTGFPDSCWASPERETAFLDHLLRLFEKAVDHYSFQAKGSGKSGAIFTSRPGQEILRRTACVRTDRELIMRFEVGFPANGRTINARELEKILFDYLPPCASGTLYYKNIKPQPLMEVLTLADEQAAIRRFLAEKGFCAFVADGAVLPRASGVSNAPMKNGVPFSSPENLRLTIPLPGGKTISGMGIPQGITLITGGGYHGKSTLLKALEAGVYNHIPGDGREYVITDASALKLRAEDHRSIQNVDISGFIDRLPGGRDTTAFSTEDASGSTSQAAGVIEGLEAGASLFLMDEDTCATNFMVRDELMQRVIHPDKEPITPFINRIRDLWENRKVSTILVSGSSGSYFHVADLILQADHYQIRDITEAARKAAENYPFEIPEIPSLTYRAGRRRLSAPDARTGQPQGRFRHGRPSRADSNGRGGRGDADDRPAKIKVQGRDQLFYGKELIDLRYVEQLIDPEQTKALGYFLSWLCANADGRSLSEQIRSLYSRVEKEGFGFLCPGNCPPFVALPRIQEVFACCNRYRGIRL
ncbi:MAG: ABC-ATPase domain-containing protein [Candidatus Limivivens sp.]|nr:ABC-ATPase domain-containing protein [Candidatus Limivivens sp.]